MPQRWKRQVEAVPNPSPYANNPAPGLGLPGLASGPDAPISARARRIFYGAIGGIVVIGIALVIVAR